MHRPHVADVGILALGAEQETVHGGGGGVDSGEGGGDSRDGRDGVAGDGNCEYG